MKLLIFIILLVGCTTSGGANPKLTPRSLKMSEVTIHMQAMQFKPAQIHVTTEESLMITLVNEDDIPHDFILQDATRMVHIFVPSGKRIVTSLYFEEPGIFEFVCSQAGHKEAGMVGTIIAERIEDR